MTDTTRDAWSWPEHRRRDRVTVEAPLRPRDMLAAHGYDAAHRCGDCRSYLLGKTSAAGRCLRSLRGGPPSAGYRWQAAWAACGAWQARVVADRSARPPTGAQLMLLPLEGKDEERGKA